MTTFVQFWVTLVANNSGLMKDETKVTLKVSELRRFLHKAFDAGYASKKSPFYDLFGGLFK
jgi:hypothetical protein